MKCVTLCGILYIKLCCLSHRISCYTLIFARNEVKFLLQILVLEDPFKKRVFMLDLKIIAKKPHFIWLFKLVINKKIYCLLEPRHTSLIFSFTFNSNSVVIYSTWEKVFVKQPCETKIYTGNEIPCLQIRMCNRRHFQFRVLNKK